MQQTAALALGRLANYSEELAEAVVGNEILPQLVYSLSEQNVRSLSDKMRLPRRDRLTSCMATWATTALLQKGSRVCAPSSGKALS